MHIGGTAWIGGAKGARDHLASEGEAGDLPTGWAGDRRAVPPLNKPKGCAHPGMPLPGAGVVPGMQGKRSG